MAYDYDVIVIGGGAAGLVASKFAAGVGKKVALIEKHRLGGECTLYGCVPSKALIKAANSLHRMKRAGAVGLKMDGPLTVATGDVFKRVRSVVDAVYEGHRPEVLERAGIDVLMGDPRFIDNYGVEVNGRRLSASSFIISTGSSALVPPISGMDGVPFLTNQSLFDLDQVPESMIVLGGGPIGIEMAQAFNYLGTRVTVVEMADQILARDDRELSDMLATRLAERGVVLRVRTKAVELQQRDGAIVLITEDREGRRAELSGERLLVALGRKANVDGLDLSRAGIEYTAKGIATDDRLCTAAGNIYACGDVVGPYQFSHMAEYQARIAARNALFPLKARATYEHYIWCTFTDPEFAHAGLTEEEARAQHDDKVKVYRWQFRVTDRARTEAEEFGLAKFVCDRSHRLLGAHILGARAGELIHEAQIIKTLGVPFHKLDSVIHVYPTFSDVVRQPAKMDRIDRIEDNFLVKAARTLLGDKRRGEKES